MIPTRDLIRRQLELEDEQRSLGARRYRSGTMPWKPEAGAADEQANLPPGKQLLKLAILPTAELLQEFIDRTNAGAAGKRHSAADPLLLSEPHEVAYLTIRVLVTGPLPRPRSLRRHNLGNPNAPYSNLHCRADRLLWLHRVHHLQVLERR